jgi:hypothetical protein
MEKEYNRRLTVHSSFAKLTPRSPKFFFSGMPRKKLRQTPMLNPFNLFLLTFITIHSFRLTIRNYKSYPTQSTILMYIIFYHLFEKLLLLLNPPFLLNLFLLFANLFPLLENLLTGLLLSPLVIVILSNLGVSIFSITNVS